MHVTIPEKGDRLLRVLNIPLMLTLYLQIEGISAKQKAYPYLEFRDNLSAGNLIRNFIQKEILNYSDYVRGVDIGLFIFSVIAILPFIMYHMEKKGELSVSDYGLRVLIKDAVKYYEDKTNCIPDQVNRASRGHSLIFESISEDDIYSYIVEKSGIIVPFTEEGIDVFRPMHQDFRDGLAALFLCNVGLGYCENQNTLPQEYMISQSDYVVRFMSEMLNKDEVGRLWKMNQLYTPTNIISCRLLMEIIGMQQGYDYNGIDFSGMDLTNISLYSFLDFRPGLPRDKGAFKNTKVSHNTFMPIGHNGGINCIATNNAGNIVVSGSYDRTLRVWKLENEECLFELEGHTGAIKAVAVNSNKKLVISGSDDRTLRLWDYEKGLFLRDFIGHTGTISSVAISSDGETIFSGSNDNTIRIWNIEKTDRVYVFNKHKYRITSISLDEERSIAVSGDANGSVYIWNYNENSVISHIKFSSSRIIGAFLIHDKKHVIIGTSDGHIQTWGYSGEHCKCINEVSHLIRGKFTCMKISEDEKYVILGTYHWNAYLLDINTGHCKQIYGRHTDRISEVLISQNDNHLISASWDKTIRIWNMKTGECMRTLGMQTNCVATISMSADGHYVAIGFRNGAVSIWNAKSGICEQYFIGDRGAVLSVFIDEHGDNVVSGSWDGNVRIWNIASKKHKLLNYMPQDSEGFPANNIRSVSMSANGLYTLSGNTDGTVCLWETMTGDLIRTLKGHNQRVESISTNIDGSKAVSVDRDGIVYAWELHNKERFKRLIMKDKNVTSIGMDLDGKIIVAGSYKRFISMLDFDTCDTIREFGRTKQHIGRITTVAISADGKTIVSGSMDRIMSVWNTETGDRVFQSRNHIGRVVSVSISADGKYAVSSDADNCVRIWSIEKKKCIHKIHPFVDYHLIGVDLREAKFESIQLKEQCRQNGAIVD